MKNIREHSIKEATTRAAIEVQRPSVLVSDFYASNVFGTEAMRSALSEEAFNSVMASIEKGSKIERNIADQVAAAMKTWAIGKGATHFTHWFQPLTGATAEKHDAFFTPKGGKGIETFSGGELVQGEPDGSSFPSGGLRDTHEARGYTAWDPTSPAFIMEVSDYGKTLCIPTIFVTYSGQSMDFKGPLLKSQHYLEKAALEVCHYFDRNVKRITPTLGWEQEFFLIDEAFYYARPDLMACGRTLLGCAPARGQQLHDHYFGSIPERVLNYMLELETEAWKLGVPLSTRHNEVAPGQFEFAPVFDEVNRAVDQNQLLMDMMEKVARRHRLRVLFHEKPFAGLNGSGKHCNWSMGTDTGVNLLSPGKTPRTNLQFLTFFINTIKAVHEYADVLRAAIASAGNDHRLGANEAPPAIISVFIGSTLFEVLEEMEKKVKNEKMDEYEKDELKLNLHQRIPDVLLDNTDRNRTSPFAFTGNKFEFRAVGSSFNCAFPMTVLNTIVAKQLETFKEQVETLIAQGEKKDGAILRVLHDYIIQSKNILFEGDNYSKEWEKEAEKRGLSNVKTAPHALNFLKDKKNQDLFIQSGVLSAEELKARYEVWNEQYQMKIAIEAHTLKEILQSQIIPTAIDYLNRLLDNVRQAEAAGIQHTEAQRKLIQHINQPLNRIFDLIEQLNAEQEKASALKPAAAQAQAHCERVKPLLETLRHEADTLEMYCDDRQWALPKYREMLFIK